MNSPRREPSQKENDEQIRKAHIQNLTTIMETIAPYGSNDNAENNRLYALLNKRDRQTHEFAVRFHSIAPFQEQIREIGRLGHQFVENNSRISQIRLIQQALLGNTSPGEKIKDKDKRKEFARYEKEADKIIKENVKVSKVLQKGVENVIRSRHEFIKAMLKSPTFASPRDRQNIFVDYINEVTKNMRSTNISLPTFYPTHPHARMSAQQIKGWLETKKKDWPKEAKNTFTRFYEAHKAFDDALAREQRQNKKDIKNAHHELKSKFVIKNSNNAFDETGKIILARLDKLIGLLEVRAHLITGEDHKKNETALQYYKDARQQANDVIQRIANPPDGGVVLDPLQALQDALENTRQRLKDPTPVQASKREEQWFNIDLHDEPKQTKQETGTPLAKPEKSDRQVLKELFKQVGNVAVDQKKQQKQQHRDAEKQAQLVAKVNLPTNKGPTVTKGGLFGSYNRGQHTTSQPTRTPTKPGPGRNNKV